MAEYIVRFWQELKRRKVVRVAIVYAVVGWVLVQVSAAVFPALLLPEWSSRLVVVLALIGFPIALVLSWAFESSPDGLRRDTADVAPGTALVTTPTPAPETAGHFGLAGVRARARA